MAEPFKNMLNQQFLERFTKDLKQVIDLDEKKFVSQVMDNEWENRELMQRVRHITTVLKNFLPADYKDAIGKILDLIKCLRARGVDFSEVDDNKFGLSLEYGGILSCFIEMYGSDDYSTSIKAIEEVTQFTSCEFSVRPLIIKYPNEMMNQMLVWSKHKHWGVRRLSSEGCRPRLPWAMALPDLKKNPLPIIPILENLKNDKSKFVRLSVANNLNDISKDNPKTVIDLMRKWKGENENIDWIIKHASRTLLKDGNAEVLKLFGLDTGKNIDIKDFQILTPNVKIGNSLEFCFKLLNNNSSKTKIRLEYGIYYQKANRTLSKKVHKISEKEYAEKSTTQITRKHPFKIVTTRVLYPGLHQVSLIINGNELEKYDFLLVE